MYRLGLHLTLRSGREAFTRLVVTALAVAVGVAIMLAVLADFNAFKTTMTAPTGKAPRARYSAVATRRSATPSSGTTATTCTRARLLSG